MLSNILNNIFAHLQERKKTQKGEISKSLPDSEVSI